MNNNLAQVKGGPDNVHTCMSDYSVETLITGIVKLFKCDLLLQSQAMVIYYTHAKQSGNDKVALRGS